MNGSKTNKTSEHKKKIKRRYNNNLYLYLQIIVSLIFIVVSVMLKVKDGEAFYAVKNDYSEFFTTEITEYSNFSHKTYIEKITSEIAEKYDILMDTISYLHGKGANDTYPSNVSLQKYKPEEKGTLPLKGIITSEFGVRKNPFNRKENDFHTGIDIAAEKGTFIKAAFGGTVTEIGYTDIAGNYIKIKTNKELQTFYGHTQFIFVNENEEIVKGQVIASVGDTGLVTGPHLHFEVLHNGYRVNPEYAVE